MKQDNVCALFLRSISTDYFFLAFYLEYLLVASYVWLIQETRIQILITTFTE